MLTALRSKASSWIVKGFLALLVASFAVWGIGDIFRGSSRQAPIAEVGDVPIYAETVQRQLQRIVGTQIEPEQARQLGFVDAALNQVVNDTLLQVYAQKIGLAVPDTLVADVIRSTPAFRNASGDFDANMYTATLQQNRLTEDAFVSDVRQRIVRQDLAAAIESGVVTPESLADALRAYRAETRVAETILIPYSAMTGIATPDEATLAAYHQANEAMFRAPEYRTITLVRLRPEDVAAETAVPDDRLREEYEARKAEFDVPERRQVSAIVFTGPDAEASAKGAAERLRQGAAFEAVARETTGRDPTDLGLVDRASILVKELAEPAFSTPQGQLSAPVQSPLGWHILRVGKIEPAHSPAFEGVRDQLAKAIALEEAGDAIIELGQKLEDELAGGATLEEAAQRIGVQPVKIEAVDATGKGRKGEAVPEVGPAILDAAFVTEAGQVSPLDDTDEGGHFILRVDAVTPPALRPLNEVRDQVLAAWQAEQRQKAAQAKAQAAVERLRSGQSMASVAQENIAAITTSKPFTRNEDDPAAHISPDLAVKLFGIGQGEAITATVPEGEVVARLVEIRPAASRLDTVAEDELRREVAAEIEADLQAQFMNALRNEVDVETNERALDQFF